MEKKVRGPGFGLQLIGVLGTIAAIINLQALSGMGAMKGAPVLISIIQIVVAVVIFLGGTRMKKLKAYRLAFTASILTLAGSILGLAVSIPDLTMETLSSLPWLSIVGLIFGLWALVVLLNKEVKAAFNRK